MLIAALTSRSWTVPHAQAHSRTHSGILSTTVPQAEHSFDDGKNRSTRANLRPYSLASYSSMRVNADQPASCTLLACRLRAGPVTGRSST